MMTSFYSKDSLSKVKKDGLMQGDILYPVPFAVVPLSESVAVQLNEEEPALKQLGGWESEGDCNISAPVETSYGMILSQSCDLSKAATNQNPKLAIVVAEVVSTAIAIPGFDDLDDKPRANKINGLTKLGSNNWGFYLPANSGRSFPSSLVYLNRVQCFAPSEHDALTSLLKLRLSEVARQSLQAKLSFVSGRFGAPDDLFYSTDEWDAIKD